MLSLSFVIVRERAPESGVALSWVGLSPASAATFRTLADRMGHPRKPPTEQSQQPYLKSIGPGLEGKATSFRRYTDEPTLHLRRGCAHLFHAHCPLRCRGDGGGSVALKPCSRCKAVVYCGGKHQAAHWKTTRHKAVCKSTPVVFRFLS